VSTPLSAGRLSENKTSGKSASFVNCCFAGAAVLLVSELLLSADALLEVSISGLLLVWLARMPTPAEQHLQSQVMCNI